MPDELAIRLTSDGRNLGSCSSTVSFAGYSNLCALSSSSLTVDRAYLASSHLNKAYFDPTKTYSPPFKADGSRFPQSDFNAAYVDGYAQSGTKVDLDKDYRALMDDFYYYGQNGGSNRFGFTISPSADKGKAFYYDFNPTLCLNQYSNLCYKYETVSSSQKNNFANWFSYYRTRIMGAKAGIGVAFMEQKDGIRVGYGTLNSSGTVISGVQKFGTTRKQAFMTWLNTASANGGTPLRKALVDAGEYYKTSSPWREDPTNQQSAIVSCRQSFTILMTDGYWSTETISVGNNDNTAGATINGKNNTTYRYQPGPPFSDSVSNTLADVAMNYWKNDLRPEQENNVPTSTINPAFWQHMVTFGVGLGVSGSINPVSAFEAIAAKSAINWPNPFNDPSSAKIDDLLHASVNGRGGFFSAADPLTFATELSKTLTQIVARVGSASNLAGATSTRESAKQVFQGRFFSGDWTGDLWAYSLDNNTTPTWKASQQLDSQDWTTRKIFYSDDVGKDKGKAFEGNKVGSLTLDQVNYLRGDRSKELNKTGGIFRVRNSILGDIAYSTPFYVGEPDNRFYERYSGWDKDELQDYAPFLTAYKNRTKAVYVGSNDGMLHGFNALNGQELFAYVPFEMLPKLPALTSKDYQHQFYVDGSPTVADAYVNGKWRSILVGTNGRGGKNVFALDVTQPASFTKDSVLWERSIPELGNYTGEVVIAKLGSPAKDAKWYAILGNGVNSQNHTASLILLPLNGDSPTVLTVDTGTAASPNGLFQPVGFDADNTGAITKVFAGDLKGNVWQFDFSGKNASDGKVAYSGSPLFTAKDASGNRQSVTGGLSIGFDSTTGNSWLFFGTGKYLEQSDQSSTSVQSWYGLILPFETDGSSSNGNSNKNKNTVIETSVISGRSDLAQRTITNVGNARSVNEVGSLDGKRGWYMDLPDSGERVVSTPQLIGNSLIVNTIVPTSDICSPEGFGYVMAIDPYQGKRLKRNFFDVNGDKIIDDDDKITVDSVKVPASGLRFSSAPGEPIFYKDIMKVGLENAEVIDVLVDTDERLGRVSWREVLN
ncbi:pilus assembly protein [Rheinheimera sp. UJ63]|nr:PilC/PilY family type IV pilus protein [Rheinheimera sp. UJ63]MCF4010213.1 pilus assembly protein PilY [Rheinheimera sp. UJ63]